MTGPQMNNPGPATSHPHRSESGRVIPFPLSSHTPCCSTCGGTGWIKRPEQEIPEWIEHRYLIGRHVEVDSEFVITTIGGVDACPECAERAEIDFCSRQARSEASR